MNERIFEVIGYVGRKIILCLYYKVANLDLRKVLNIDFLLHVEKHIDFLYSIYDFSVTNTITY